MTTRTWFIALVFFYSCSGSDVLDAADTNEVNSPSNSYRVYEVKTNEGVLIKFDFNEEGVLVQERKYVNDVECGAWRTYFDNGRIKTEFVYEHVPEGEVASKMRKHTFGNSIDALEEYYNPRNGEKRFWNSDGSLMKIEVYQDDSLVSILEKQNDY